MHGRVEIYVPLARLAARRAQRAASSACSQPIVIEAFGDEPIDPTGLSGLLALVGFVPVLLAMRGPGPKRAYWLGFLACFVQFTMNVQWLVVAMVVFGRIPLLASWAILSLADVGDGRLRRRGLRGHARAGGPVPLADVARLSRLRSCAAETLAQLRARSAAFPWGNVGTSFATVPLLLQPASLFGVYGLVLCAGLCVVDRSPRSSLGGCEPAQPCARRSEARRPRRRRARSWRGSASAPCALAHRRHRRRPRRQGGAAAGQHRAGHPQPPAVDGPHDPRALPLAARRGRSTKGAQLVVWPEAAFPLRLRRDLANMLDQRLVDDDGARCRRPRSSAPSRYEPIVARRQAAASCARNSAFVVGEGLAGGRPRRQDAPRAVRRVRAVAARRHRAADRAHRRHRRPARLRGHPREARRARVVKLGTTICYEGIFPEISRQLRKAGAELHVNVTNDGWYGISGAAQQHLDFYAMRAVESGMPVVRAANTGTLGVGRQPRPPPRRHADLRDTAPSSPTSRSRSSDTPYVMLGEWLALAVRACSRCSRGCVAIVGRRRAQRQARRARQRPRRRAASSWPRSRAPSCSSRATIPTRRNATRYLLVVLAGLLVGAGALSGRPWGRKAQMVVGLLALVFWPRRRPRSARRCMLARRRGSGSRSSSSSSGARTRTSGRWTHLSSTTHDVRLPDTMTDREPRRRPQARARRPRACASTRSRCRSRFSRSARASPSSTTA